MLKKLTIDSLQDGPHLLITAGVHGDEYEPMEACRRLYTTILSYKLLIRGKLTLVPVVNEPAFARGARTGDDGIDLARICPGKVDGNKTEQIAHSLSTLIRSADYYVDMHNGGNAFNIYPLAGYMLHDVKRVLEKQRELASSFLLPVVWGTHPALEGRSLSVARDAEIPAIYTEIGGGGIYIQQMTRLAYEGCLNILRNLFMISESVKGGEIIYHLEDHRENSGHLQRYLLAPRNGFFIPEVALGDVVEVSQTIGKIQNNQGDQVTTIKADQAGVVFNIRSKPSVRQGDSLGAILPATPDHKLQSIYE